MDATTAFRHLHRVLQADNGADFPAYESDLRRATPPLTAMIQAGFFLDDPNDLDGSFWMMAAGEETASREYFAKCAEQHMEVVQVLNDIFERPDAGTPDPLALGEIRV